MAFPSTSIIDSGAGADANPAGGAWSQIGGITQALQRLANALAGDQAGAQSGSYRNDITPGPDSECGAQVSALPTNNTEYVRAYARLVNPGLTTKTGYFVRAVKNTGTVTYDWNLVRQDNGTSTVIGPSVSQNLAANDQVGIEALGSAITGYYKPSAGSWTSVLSATDATYATAGAIGIVTNGAATRFVNVFGGTSVTARPDRLPRPILWKLGRRRGLRLPIPARVVQPGPAVVTTPVSAALDAPIEATQDLAPAAATDPVEAAGGAAATGGDPVEASQGVAAAGGDPVEATAALAAQASDPVEVPAGIAAPAADPVEAGQGLAAPAVDPVDAAGGLASSLTDPVEAGQQIAAPITVPVEALAGVATVTGDPVEALQALAAPLTDPVESVQNVAAVVLVPVEALQGVATQTTDPVEASGTAPVAQTSTVPIEALAAIAAQLGDPVEASQQIAASALVPIETLQGVIRATPVPVEAAAGLTAASTVPVEAGRAVVAVSVVPLEALQQIAQALEVPIDAASTGFVVVVARPARASTQRVGIVRATIVVLDGGAGVAEATPDGDLVRTGGARAAVAVSDAAATVE